MDRGSFRDDQSFPPVVTSKDSNVLKDGRYGNLPLYFIENRGMVNDSVFFYIQASDKTIFFSSDGITVTFTSSVVSSGKTSNVQDKPGSFQPVGSYVRDSVVSCQRHAIRLDFEGANKNIKPEGVNKTDAVVSYFKGPRENWVTGLPTYSSIIYHDLWQGIDLVYTGKGNKLKYTFIVHPGADPGNIQLVYRGVSSVQNTSDGQLKITTPGGSFIDDKPYAYQETDSSRADVPVTFAVFSDSPEDEFRYSFHVEEYDKSRTLILDPVIFIYCGYIGGAIDDVGCGIAVDATGSAYISGRTSSPELTFPVTVGPDLTYNSGGEDAFVAKINPAGTGLVYLGYIGGDGSDRAWDIAVDSSGCAYVVGNTNSDETTFPVTVGPDLTYAGGGLDAFVVKVNPAGTALIYCGYVGGAGFDEGYAIDVDSADNAYISGLTTSTETTFPVTVGPDLTFNTGTGADAFAAKVNATGTALVYCGYIGGTFTDFSHGIAVDSSGAAYVTGTTDSSEASFPVKVGPDLTYNRNLDGFIVKINPSGAGFDYAGYIGGIGLDEATGVAVDSAGNAYVTGSTGSDETTFPVTVGPDLTHNGGSDAFVVKVNPAGTGFVYAGYIGGAVNEPGSGMAIDRFGNAYICGPIASDETTFPVLEGPDLTYNGAIDGYVARVNASGTGLDWAGYIGGSNLDTASQVAVDSAGDVYITGETESRETSFPVLVGPDLTYNGGYRDAWVARIRFIPAITPTSTVTNTPAITPTPTPPPTIFCCWDQPSNPGCVLNSMARDEHPTLTSDDRYLFFTSARPLGSGRKDLWYAERIGPGVTDWTIPENLGPSINTDMDEGGPSLTGDSLHLYFHAYNKTVSNFDLYYSDWNKVTSSWNPRTHLGWMINSNLYNDRHPHIWQDGKTLYFDSDRPGGTGAVDLWMTRKVRGRWMPPEPLPNPINTTAYDAAPYVYETGPVQYLYFESERGGISKLYRAEWDSVDGQWLPPLLMCREFSNALHPYINSTGSELFFHSILPGGCREMDIWISKCLPSPTPIGTWFSPTPTGTPTPMPLVPVVTGENISFFFIFLSVCILIGILFSKKFLKLESAMKIYRKR